jgi:hypothetical protein
MQNTVLIAAGTVAALPLIPTGHFLAFGWPARKDQIVSRFSDEAIRRYRQMFFPESRFQDQDGFAEEYTLRYGRHLFVFAVRLFAGRSSQRAIGACPGCSCMTGEAPAKALRKLRSSRSPAPMSGSPST